MSDEKKNEQKEEKGETLEKEDLEKRSFSKKQQLIKQTKFSNTYLATWKLSEKGPEEYIVAKEIAERYHYSLELTDLVIKISENQLKLYHECFGIARVRAICKDPLAVITDYHRNRCLHHYLHNKKIILLNEKILFWALNIADTCYLMYHRKHRIDVRSTNLLLSDCTNYLELTDLGLMDLRRSLASNSLASHALEIMLSPEPQSGDALSKIHFAPELSGINVKRTLLSDVYSYAIVLLEIYLCRNMVDSNPEVHNAYNTILNKKTLSIPSELKTNKEYKWLSDIVDLCLAESSARPTFETLSKSLHKHFESIHNTMVPLSQRETVAEELKFHGLLHSLHGKDDEVVQKSMNDIVTKTIDAFEKYQRDPEMLAIVCSSTKKFYSFTEYSEKMRQKVGIKYVFLIVTRYWNFIDLQIAALGMMQQMTGEKWRIIFFENNILYFFLKLMSSYIGWYDTKVYTLHTLIFKFLVSFVYESDDKKKMSDLLLSNNGFYVERLSYLMDQLNKKNANTNNSSTNNSSTSNLNANNSNTIDPNVNEKIIELRNMIVSFVTSSIEKKKPDKPDGKLDVQLAKRFLQVGYGLTPNDLERVKDKPRDGSLEKLINMLKYAQNSSSTPNLIISPIPITRQNTN